MTSALAWRSAVVLLWAAVSSVLAGDVAGPSLAVYVTGRTPTADEARQIADLADKAPKAPNVFAVQEELHSFTLEEPFWDFEISSAWTSLGAWGASAVLLASRLASPSAPRPPR